MAELHEAPHVFFIIYFQVYKTKELQGEYLWTIVLKECPISVYSD